jgi:hypothetical protein
MTAAAADTVISQKLGTLYGIALLLVLASVATPQKLLALPARSFQCGQWWWEVATLLCLKQYVLQFLTDATRV